MSLRIYSLIAIVCSLHLFCGCEKEPDGGELRQPVGFVELVEAHEDGKVFISASHEAGTCTLTFEDGYTLVIDEAEFKVHDCTAISPAKVELDGAWWTVGGVDTGIRADYSRPRKETLPVYVYFDSITLYAHLSNGVVLKFWSSALEQQKQEQEETDKENAKVQNIPVVRIKTKWGAEIKDKKNYVDGTITITDPEKMYSDVTEFTADMGIRGRGNSTWEWPKKPWKVKLDEKAEILGMPADKEWALLANYSDRTLLRNVVAMKISEICGLSWTPRIRSVEVYLNDEYQGVYTICEHKKVSKARVNIDVVDETANEGEAVEGGYYLEIDETMDKTVKWWTSMGVPVMFKEPEEPTSAQYDYVTGYVEAFEQALQGQDFADPVTGYAAYVDVDSFINYYIVQELTKNIDGNLRRSSYMTKERGKKLELYHVWDFDLTLGNCGYFDGNVGNGPHGFWIKNFAPNNTYGGGWYFRLFDDPAFVDAVQARWNELFPELEKITDFIDDQAFSLQPSSRRNFEKWDINTAVDWVGVASLGSYEAEIEYLKTFYSERLIWLNTYLNLL